MSSQLEHSNAARRRAGCTAGPLAADGDNEEAVLGAGAPGALADGAADLEAVHAVPLGQVAQAFTLVAVAVGEHIDTIPLS